MKNRSPIFVLFVTIFIDLLGFGLIIPILPIFALELDASSLQIGFIAGVYSLMNFIFAPFWGTLSDKIGRRPVMLISIFITMLAYVFFAFTNSIWLLFISRVFAGIGSANISAAQAYISDITEPQDRAKNMGLIGAAFGLGFIFGPPAGGFLKSFSGEGNVVWVGVFAAVLCAINWVLAYAYLPESLKVKQHQKQFRFKPISDLFFELKKPVIRELFTVNFLFINAFAIMQITLAMLWIEHYSLDEKQVGFVFMFMGLSSAIVQGGLVGILNKKFGEKQLLGMGTISMAIGLLSIPFVPESYFFLQLISILFISFANGCITPALTSLISRAAEKHEQGQVLGMNQSFGSLARVIGPVLGGVLYSLNFRVPYIFGAVLMIFTFFFVRLLIKESQKFAA